MHIQLVVCTWRTFLDTPSLALVQGINTLMQSIDMVPIDIFIERHHFVAEYSLTVYWYIVKSI